jgi:hypothetical protein
MRCGVINKNRVASFIKLMGVLHKLKLISWEDYEELITPTEFYNNPLVRSNRIFMNPEDRL